MHEEALVINGLPFRNAVCLVEINFDDVNGWRETVVLDRAVYVVTYLVLPFMPS